MVNVFAKLLLTASFYDAVAKDNFRGLYAPSYHLSVDADAGGKTSPRTHSVEVTSAALQSKQTLSAEQIAANVVAARREHYRKGNLPVTDLVACYGVAFLGVVLCLTYMFRPMGLPVVQQTVVYVTCLSFLNIAVKRVYVLSFPYPNFVTSAHLFTSTIVAFSVLLLRKFQTGAAIETPTKRELWFGVLPIACALAASLATENSALLLVSVALAEVVCSCAPAMSFCLCWVFKVGISAQLLLPVCLVIIGCFISVQGELSFSLTGLLLMFSSIFFRGVKAVMQQKIMTGKSRSKFDPVTLMAWSCLIGCVISFCLSGMTEGVAPLIAFSHSANAASLKYALLASAAISCTLNLVSLYVTRKLGAVGVHLVAQTKAVLVVLGDMALLGETFTHTQKLGFVFVLIGVHVYARIQGQLAKNEDDKERQEHRNT